MSNPTSHVTIGAQNHRQLSMGLWTYFYSSCYHRSPVPQTAVHGALHSDPYACSPNSLTTEPFPKVSGINRFLEMPSLKQVTDRPISTNSQERGNTVYLCFTRKSLQDFINFEAAENVTSLSKSRGTIFILYFWPKKCYATK